MVEFITTMNLWTCPICGNKTDTYRHPYARVWCTVCGHVLRTEGDRTIVHESFEDTVEPTGVNKAQEGK